MQGGESALDVASYELPALFVVDFRVPPAIDELSSCDSFEPSPDDF